TPKFAHAHQPQSHDWLNHASQRSDKSAAALHKKTQGAWVARIFLAQRRKDAKKTSENAAALCVFAPLRERYPSGKTLFVQSRSAHSKEASLKDVYAIPYRPLNLS